MTRAEAAGLLIDVVAPAVAKGVIIRRPRGVAVAERLNLGARAIRRMQRLSERYGPGPVMIPSRVRPRALILSAHDARRVLDDTPAPFSAASSERGAALGRFEPEGVPVGESGARATRRAANGTVLETARPAHSLAERFLGVVAEEARPLVSRSRFGWPEFVEAWFRMVRRVVLGELASEDRQLTDLVAALRPDADCAFGTPRRDRLRGCFYRRLHAHLRRSEPGSLAERLSLVPRTGESAPMGQVPQWLFAFDAAGIALARTLALLATHPGPAGLALDQARATAPAELDYLRACFLDSVRLWPTTPMTLRRSQGPIEWETGVLPPGANILIFAPFFHRDARRLPFAHRFAPEIWLSDAPEEHWGLVPFCAGPARCPGRELVLLLTSAFLAELIRDGTPRLATPRPLGPDRPLPLELSASTLAFART